MPQGASQVETRLFQGGGRWSVSGAPAESSSLPR